MANSKISALTSATTPLAGTETLPVVQSSTTKQVSVANLTAGRDVATNSVAVAAGVPVYFNGTSGNTQMLYYASLVIDAQVNGTKGWRLYAPGAGTSEMRGDWAVNNTGGGSGNLTMSTGNLVQGTAAKGINFTANTPLAGMTSQLLNWYEEGSYTPTVTASSGSITTYSSTGKYTRIGRQVTVDIQVTLTNAGTASGALIATLPFTCGQFPAIGCGREDQNTGTMLQARISSGAPSSVVILTYANLTIIGTSNVVQITITYFV